MNRHEIIVSLMNIWFAVTGAAGCCIILATIVAASNFWRKGK